MTISAAFYNAARTFANRTAVVSNGGKVSYLQLAERTARLTNALRSRGIAENDVVAGIMPNRQELIEIDLACSTGGFVRTLLNSKAPGSEYTHCLNLAEAKVLFFDHSLIDVVEKVRDHINVREYICIGGRCEWAHEYEVFLSMGALKCEIFPATLSSPHSIYFTSGTTGRPKGVLLAHLNWIRIAYNYLSEIDPTSHRKDVALMAAPMTHGTGMLVVANLLRGATLHLMDHFDPERVSHLFATEGVTTTFMAPTMIQLLMQHIRSDQVDKFKLSSLVYGGASFPVHRLQEALNVFGTNLVQVYGQWEAPIASTLLGREEHVRGLKEGETLLLSAGRPAMFAEIAILDDNGNELASGQTGEVAIAGPQLMVGYYKDPDATNAIRHGRWQRTGDIGHTDDEGFVYITDRKKDMIISGGMNVYPRQVEEILYEHPELAEVCVVGRPSELWGETVHLVAVKKDGSKLSADDLDNWMRERIPKDRRPRSLEFVSELPKSNYGKILRRKVRDDVRAKMVEVDQTH